jgi:Ni/Co efflux regulator RcnB
MTLQRNRTRLALGILLAAMGAAGPALADKPEGKGKGKGHDRSRDDDHGNRGRGGAEHRSHFTDQHRHHVRTHFEHEHSRGHCPPGLAKKNNGCLPPGQAKKWHVGRPLPREVVYYDLPPALVVQIGVAPAGHRYVRVASDILLIAIGTGMVVDAIRDLGRM